MGAWAPLLGFRSERDELDLANGVRIEREHPPEELPDTDAFGRHIDDSGAITHYAPFRIDQFSIFSGTGSLERGNYKASKAAIEKTLTYLWLFRLGAVWIEVVNNPASGKTEIQDLAKRPRGPSSVRYELNQRDCDDFEQFVALMHRSQTSNLTDRNRRLLDLALERFSFAITRDRDYLQLSELVVAFESLLLEKGPDLKYRLALRTALLTGRTDDERLAIFDRMKKAYDRRSDYVHGEEIRLAKIGTLPQEVRQYLCNAIVQFCSLSQQAPASVSEGDWSRRYLDELALRHDVPMQVEYPDWWRPEGHDISQL